VGDDLDLPGYSEKQTTEQLGVLSVRAHMVRSGFRVTEVLASLMTG
jgi:hypothetical protein